MPPRAQRLYPRMRERPPEFRVNDQWPLRDTLRFALIPSNGEWRSVFVDTVHRRTITTVGSGQISYDHDLRRFVIRGYGNQTYLYTDLVRPGSGQLAIMFWVKPVNPGYQQSPFSWANSYMSTGPWVLTRTFDYPPQYSWYLNGSYRINYVNNTGVWSVNILEYTSLWMAYVNGSLVGTYSEYGSLSAPTVYIGSGYRGQLDAYYGDVFIWVGGSLREANVVQLSDPSNVDLRVGGIPLILPPRRRLWPVAPVAEYVKRRQLGLRAGSREVVT